MDYEQACKYDAYAIKEMGYDVGETCEQCIDFYGRPRCHAVPEDEMEECCNLDDLHQMLVAAADAGKGE
jgi:hypothetical protein